MRPSMNQFVIAHIPTLDDSGKQIIDDYGRPKTKEFKSKARVQFKSQLVTDTKGIERNVNLEIDLPKDFNPAIGTELDYIAIDRKQGKGTIVTKEEITNIAGNKIHYRTVYANA